MVRGEALLRERGYSQEQIEQLPPDAYAYRSNGEVRISGVRTQTPVRTAGISGRWVGGVGGHYQVYESGEPSVKTTLTEGEYAREIVLPRPPPEAGIRTYAVSPFAEEPVVAVRETRFVEGIAPRPAQVITRPGVPVRAEDVPERVPVGYMPPPVPVEPEPVARVEEPVPFPPEPVLPVEEKRFALTPEAAKEYVRGFDPYPEKVIKLMLGPPETLPGEVGVWTYRGFESFTRATGYAFGAAGEAFIPEKFRLDIPTGRVKVTPPAGFFKPAKIEVTPGRPIVFGKPAATEALAFAGQLFAIGGLESALIPTPRKAPELKGLGERGGISIIRRKKKLPPKIQEIEAGKFLEPKVLRAKAPKGIPRPHVELLKVGKPKKPFGRDIFLKAPPKPPELGKALTPIGKPLTLEEKVIQKFITGKPPSRAFEIRKVTPIKIQTPKGKPILQQFIAVPVTKAKAPKPLKIPPKIVVPFKEAPELGEFLVPVKPLTLKGKALLGKVKKPSAFEIRKVTPIKIQTPKGKPILQQFIAVPVTKAKVESLIKRTPLVFKEAPTTAALQKIKPLPLEEFVTKVEIISKPTRVKPPPSFLIPESLVALSRGLVRAKPPPIGKPVARLSPLEEEVRAATVVTRPKLGEFLGVTPLPKEKDVLRERVMILERLGVGVEVELKRDVGFGLVSLKGLKEEFRLKKGEKLGELALLRKDIALAEKDVLREQAREQAKEQAREQAKEQARELPRELAMPKAFDILKKPREKEILKRERELRKPRRPIIPFLLPPLKRIGPSMPRMGLPGFEVFVRKKGEFVKVSPYPLARRAALGLGARETETAARTFLLRPARRPGRRVPSLERFWRPERFRRPKGKTMLPGMAYVEKAKFAIDVPKELEEITFKGLAARRRGPTLTVLTTRKRKKKKHTKRRRKR